MKANGGTLFDKLGERGFAGGDVATNPSREDDTFWPVGPSPIGVSELIALIATAAKKKAGTKKESHWAFLLGGAGNGKSFAARSLLDVLYPSSGRKQKSDTPRRKYTFAGADCSVCVINDATIAPRSEYAEHSRIALAKDLVLWADQAKKGRSLAFACVNRGIVLEELNSLSRLDRKGLAFSGAVLRWLDGSDKSIFADTAAFPWIASVDGSPTGSWYRRLRLQISKSSWIVIHALSVDVGSLLEPRPAGGIDVVGDPQLPPQVSLAPTFRASANARLESVAGTLMGQLLSQQLCDAIDQRPSLCPIRANVSSLVPHESRANWLSALRAAEVAAGRQITYRDFWGLVALSMIGPRTIAKRRTIPGAGIAVSVDTLIEELSTEVEPIRKLDILGRLSVRRLHMALFRGEAAPIDDAAGVEAPPEFPAAKGLMLIDPAADVTRYSTAVEAAMEHISLGRKPSDHLLEHIPTLRHAWQPFDSAIEDAVIEVLNSKDASDRLKRRLISWLSGYLQRAAGCYAGGIGHEGVVSAWYRCWHSAGTSTPQFPTDLDIGLRTLLLPGVVFQSNLEQQLAVPAFSSRAVPYESAEAADGALVLTMGVHHLRLRPVRKADRLWVELVSADGSVEAQSPLDFSMLREALVCKSNSRGFTEGGTETAPRLERARASMISTGSDVPRRYALVTGGNLRELTS